MENSKTFNSWFEQPKSQQQEKKSALRVVSLTSAIADFMVWLTILGSDKRKNRQTARKAMVISRWLQLSGDSLKVPFPGVMLL